MSEITIVLFVAWLFASCLYVANEVRVWEERRAQHAKEKETAKLVSEWLLGIERPVTTERPVYPPLSEERDDERPAPVRMPMPRKTTPGEVWK